MSTFLTRKLTSPLNLKGGSKILHEFCLSKVFFQSKKNPFAYYIDNPNKSQGNAGKGSASVNRPGMKIYMDFLAGLAVAQILQILPRAPLSNFSHKIDSLETQCRPLTFCSKNCHKISMSLNQSHFWNFFRTPRPPRDLFLQGW